MLTVLVLEDSAGLEQAVARALRGALEPWLSDRGTIGFRLSVPGAPHDLLGTGPPTPRLRCIALVMTRGALKPGLRAELESLPDGPIARGGDAWPSDVVAKALSGIGRRVLSVVHLDGTPIASASTWRGRRLEWSAILLAGEGLARCDGEAVVVVEDDAELPEGDRAGVLLAGWRRLLGLSLTPDPQARLALPELLAEVAEDGELFLVARGGAWLEQPAAAEREDLQALLP